MAYLVTAKRGGIELRDGSLATDTMHKLVEGVPVVFHHMPAGSRLPGDGQILIEVAPVEDAPQPKATVAELLDVVAPKPSKHKKHRG